MRTRGRPYGFWESLHDGNELIALEEADADVVLLEKWNVRLLQQLRRLQREVEHAFERHQLAIDLGVRDAGDGRPLLRDVSRRAVTGCERERLSNDRRLLLTGVNVLPNVGCRNRRHASVAEERGQVSRRDWGLRVLKTPVRTPQANAYANA